MARITEVHLNGLKHTSVNIFYLLILMSYKAENLPISGCSPPQDLKKSFKYY